VVDSAGDFAETVASGGSGRTLEKRDLPLLLSSPPPGVDGIEAMTRNTGERESLSRTRTARKTRRLDPHW